MENPNSDIGIGTSNETILIISLIGFVLLGSTLYLLFPKAKPARLAAHRNPDEVGNNNGGGNRAQRRARARRRPEIQQQEDGGQDPVEEAVIEGAEIDTAGGENDDAREIHMSRKERLKASKRAEKEERRRMEEQRREELRQRKEAEEAAYFERKEKEREEEEKMILIQEKEKKRADLEEKKKYEKWKRSFVLEGQGNESSNVEEEWSDFITYIQQMKFVQINILQERFQLTRRDVLSRISKLEHNGTLIGLLNEKGDYLSFNDEELKNVADFVRRKGRVTNKELAMEMKRIIKV